MGRGRRARARCARAADGRGAPGSITGIKADSRVVGPGDLFVALNTGVEHVADAAARGAATLVPDDQEAALAALASLVRSKSEARVVAVVGSDRQDVDQGHPRGALQCRHPDGLGGGEPEQRDRPSAHRLPARARHGGARDRDGDARARADRGALRDRPARRRGRHARSGPSTSSSSARSSASPRRTPRRSLRSRPAGIAVVPADAPELEPHLGRTDIEIRRFDRVAGRRQPGTTGASSLGGRDVALALPFTAAPHGREHARRARRLRRARAAARPGPGGRRRDQALALARGGDAAPGRWPRRQRRLQREPDLDAGSARSTSRSVPATRRRVAILGEMAELGRRVAPLPRARSAASLDELGIELVIAVGEPRAATSVTSTGAAGLDVPDVDGSRAGARRLPRAGRRDPRQGIAGGRARRHPGLDRETGKGMVRVLIAGLVAMVIAIVIGPTFIDWLRRTGVGQQIREEGPARHIVKQGTPTMGGLLILATAVDAVPRALAVHAAGPRAAVRRRSAAPRSASPTTTSRCASAARSGSRAAGRCSVSSLITIGGRLGRDAGRLPRHRDLLPDRRRQHRPRLASTSRSSSS